MVLVVRNFDNLIKDFGHSFSPKNFDVAVAPQGFKERGEKEMPLYFQGASGGIFSMKKFDFFQ